MTRRYVRYLAASIIAAILAVLCFGGGPAISVFLLAGLIYAVIVGIIIARTPREQRRAVRRRELWMFTLAHFCFSIGYAVIMTIAMQQNSVEGGYHLRYEWAPIMLMIQPFIYIVDMIVLLIAASGVAALRSAE